MERHDRNTNKRPVPKEWSHPIMAQIDPLHAAFHFKAGTTATSGNKSEKTDKAANRKTRFSNVMEQKTAEMEMLSAGLPVEIAGMEFEEAFIYLKDQADITSDKLKSDFSLEAFSEYRKAVSDLMKFIVQSNYQVKMNRRRGMNRRFKTEKFYLIQVVDEKLDKLAADILSVHFETLQMLARIDEINGILIDLTT